MESEQPFSVYDDIVELLVKEGVDPDHIEIAQNYKANQREKLWSRVRSGEVRIVLASRPLAGEGVNIQNRLEALHNVDAPWTPALLTQGNGRIVRRGNELIRDGIIDEITIYNYQMQEGADAMVWMLLAKKGEMIVDLLSGTLSSVEGTGDMTADAESAEAVMHILMGNAEGMQIADMSRELQQLRSSLLGYSRQYGQFRSVLGMAQDHQAQFAKYEGEHKNLAEQQKQFNPDEFWVNAEGKHLNSAQAAEYIAALAKRPLKEPVVVAKSGMMDLVLRERSGLTGAGGVELTYGGAMAGHATVAAMSRVAGLTGGISTYISRAGMSASKVAPVMRRAVDMGNNLVNYLNIDRPQQLAKAVDTAQAKLDSLGDDGALRKEADSLEERLLALKLDSEDKLSSADIFPPNIDNALYDPLPEHPSAKFSIVDGAIPLGKRASVASVRLAMRRKLRSWDENKIIVVSNVRELPEAARHKGARGVSYNDVIYLVSDNIERGQEWATVLHEIAGHHTLSGMLGTEGMRQMVGRIFALAANGDAAARKALSSIPRRDFPGYTDPPSGTYFASPTRMRDGRFQGLSGDVAERKALIDLIAAGGVARADSFAAPPPYSVRITAGQITEPQMRGTLPADTEVYVLVGRRQAQSELGIAAPLSWDSNGYMEEVLGYLLEEGQKAQREKTGIRKLLSDIANAVRRWFAGFFGSTIQMSVPEILEMAHASLGDFANIRLWGSVGNPEAMLRSMQHQMTRTAKGPARMVNKAVMEHFSLNTFVRQIFGQSPHLRGMIAVLEKVDGMAQELLSEGGVLYEQEIKVSESDPAMFDQMGKVKELAQEVQANPAELLLDADGALNVRAMFESMRNATDDEVQEFRDSSRGTDMQQLASIWRNVLSDKERKILTDQQQFLARMLSMLHQGTVQMLKDADIDIEVRKSAITRLDQMFSRSRNQWYFPLSRFGDYWVDYSVQGVRGFETFEGEQDRDQAIEDLRGSGAVIKGHGRMLPLEAEHNAQGASAGFIANVIKGIQAVEENIGEEHADMLKRMVYQQWVTHSTRGARSHFVRRKRVQGYSKQHARAFADYVSEMSPFIPRSMFMPTLRNLVTLQTNALNIADYPSRVRAYLGLKSISQAHKNFVDVIARDPEKREQQRLLAQRMAWQVNQMYDFRHSWADEAAAGTVALSHFWVLAGRLSAGVVNLTQAWVSWYPQVAAVYGDRKAAVEFLTAFQQGISSVFKGAMVDSPGPFGKQSSAKWKMTEREMSIYNLVVEHGALGRTSWGTLLSQSKVVDPSNIRNAKKVRQISSALGAPLRETERLQREAAALAIIRLELSANPSQTDAAIAGKANDSVWNAFFSASRIQQGKLPRAPIGRIVMHLRYIALHMIVLNYALGLKAFKDKGIHSITQRQALGAFVRMNMVIFMLAGLAGLAVPWDFLMWLFGKITGLPLGYYANMTGRKMLGDYYDLMMGGVFNELTGWELGQRVELGLFSDDPWPSTFHGMSLRLLTEFAGVPPQVFGNVLTGIDSGLEGRQGWVQKVAPYFVKDYIRAADMVQSGRAIPYAEDSPEVSAEDVVRRLVGFSDSDMNDVRAERSAYLELKNHYIQPARRKVVNMFENYHAAVRDRRYTRGETQQMHITAKNALADYNALYGDIYRLTLRQANNTVRQRRKRARDSLDVGHRAMPTWLRRLRERNRTEQE